MIRIISLLLFSINGWASDYAESFDRAMFAPNDYGIREGKRTDAVLVIQDNKTLFEKYARGHDENKQHVMWSVSKTVMSLLYGVALKDKKIKLEQSICDFAEFKPEFCAIQIRHVLEWTTAIEWLEEYENIGNPKLSSVIAMLYGEGRQDQAQFVKSLSFVPDSKPGDIWRYSSGDSILASYLLGKIYQGEDLRQVYQQKIFNLLGMKNYTWEGDFAGTISGAYYFYTTPRDLALIGELLLNGGRYKNHQILPPEYMQFMQSVPAAFKRNRRDHGEKSISGGHIWLNKNNGTGLEKPYPSAPDDLMVLRGHWGQFLVVVPSLKLVAVRIGDNRDGSFSLNGFIEALMLYVQKETIPTDFVHMRKQSSEKIISNKKEFRDGRIKLGLSFVAKNYCSCIFVAKSDDKTCRDYAALKQVSPQISLDQDLKIATARLFYFFKRQAKFVSANQGCVLL